MAIENRNHAIFDEAVEIYAQVLIADLTLTELGIDINFDNDKTVFGSFINTMYNSPYKIAAAALGMELKTESMDFERKVGVPYQCEIEIYYPADGNVDFSITEEGLYDLIHDAAEAAGSGEYELRDNIWLCFTKHDEEAKEWIIKKTNVIGFTEKN